MDANPNVLTLHIILDLLPTFEFNLLFWKLFGVTLSSIIQSFIECLINENQRSLELIHYS